MEIFTRRKIQPHRYCRFDSPTSYTKLKMPQSKDTFVLNTETGIPRNFDVDQIDGFFFLSFNTSEDLDKYSPELLSRNHIKKANQNSQIEDTRSKEFIEVDKQIPSITSTIVTDQRVDDHDKEMKQLNLQRRMLLARVDELRMIPLEEIDRARVPIPQDAKMLQSILQSDQSDAINIVEKDILFFDCGSDLKGSTDMNRYNERKICFLCGLTFGFEFSLEFHLGSIWGYIPQSPKKLFCEFCPYVSLSSETMRMHNKHLHGKKLFDMYNGVRDNFLKELCGGTVPACKPCFGTF